MIKSLTDVASFREERAKAWAQNSSYWLNQPLRHVVDIGHAIIDAILENCTGPGPQTVVDLGCGEGWVLRSLRQRSSSVRYIGVDSNEEFISVLRQRHSEDLAAEFYVGDLERPLPAHLENRADVVVNAFTWFEVADIEAAVRNSAFAAKSSGVVLVATIDKTFLILAGSDSMPSFVENLRAYETLPGVKYFFQPIDLGDKPSEKLVYPSVLYSFEDYLNAALRTGLRLGKYEELIFTTKPIPKIYQLFTLTKME